MPAMIAVSAWVARSLAALPSPVHRMLDAWSQRIAMKRRERRRKAIARSLAK